MLSIPLLYFLRILNFFKKKKTTIKKIEIWKYQRESPSIVIFSKNFIILGLTTTLVITIVKSSLALSLGLVGALSIVRFRAAIKEPEELVYLFLVIATGLGCGAGQLRITSIGIFLAIIISIILIGIGYYLIYYIFFYLLT